MIVRTIGCILTGAGCVGLGLWYRQQFSDRLYHVRILISILDMMMSQVRYSKAVLPECCLKLSERLEEPYKSAFAEISEGFGGKTGEACGELFYRKMEECLGQVPLGKEEKRLFLEFAKESSFEDTRMQLTSMEQYEKSLKKIAGRLEEEVMEKGRMAMGLGTLGGLLLIIILL